MAMYLQLTGGAVRAAKEPLFPTYVRSTLPNLTLGSVHYNLTKALLGVAAGFVTGLPPQGGVALVSAVYSGLSDN